MEISAGMPTALPEGEEEIPLLSTKWELSDGMKLLDLSNESQDGETEGQGLALEQSDWIEDMKSQQKLLRGGPTLVQGKS